MRVGYEKIPIFDQYLACDLSATAEFLVKSFLYALTVNFLGSAVGLTVKLSFQFHFFAYNCAAFSKGE